MVPTEYTMHASNCIAKQLEDTQLLVTVVYEVVLHLNKCPLDEHKIKIYVTRDTPCD